MKIKNILIFGHTGYIGQMLITFFNNIKKINIITVKNFNIDIINDNIKLSDFVNNNNIHCVIDLTRKTLKQAIYANFFLKKLKKCKYICFGTYGMIDANGFTSTIDDIQYIKAKNMLYSFLRENDTMIILPLILNTKINNVLAFNLIKKYNIKKYIYIQYKDILYDYISDVIFNNNNNKLIIIPAKKFIVVNNDKQTYYIK